MRVVEKPRRQVKQAGVSLVETLVALALGLAMVSVAFNLYVSNRSVFRQIEAMTRLQESASIATALLETDIRQAAGTLCRNHAPMTSLLSATNNYWESVESFGLVGLRGYESSTTDPIVGTSRIAGDSISIVSDNAGAVARVIAPATHASSQDGLAGSYTFQVDTVDGFQAGTVALACDYERAVLFQITRVSNTTPPTIELQAGGGSAVYPGNCGVLMKRLGGTGEGISPLDGNWSCTSANTTLYKQGSVYPFGPGSMVGEHTFHHWYIGRNASGGSSLYRRSMDYETNGSVKLGDSKEMVENVTDMQIEYLPGFLYTGYPFNAYYKTAAQISGIPRYTYRSVIAVRIVLTLTSPDKVGLAASNVASAATYTVPINVAIRSRMPGVVRR